MKKIGIACVVFFYLIVFPSSVFAGPKEEGRTPYFRFEVNIDEDLDSSITVLLDAVDPGDVYKGTLRLINPEEIEAKYSLKMSNGVVGERTDYVFSGTGNSLGLGNWVKFDKTEFELKGAGASEIVPFTISIPKNAEPGDYVARIEMQLVDYDFKEKVDEAKVVQGSSGSKAYATTSMASIMLFNVRGDINYKVLLEDAGWKFQAGSGYFIDTILTNSSNVAVRPLLSVLVKDRSGAELYKKDFLYLSSLFSGVTNEQSFHLADLKELPYGKYDVTISAYFMSEYEYFKLINSHGVPSVDVMKLAGKADFSVWVLPVIVIYVTIGVFLFLIIAYIFWNYYRRRNQDQQDGNNPY